ncbi:MAG: phosphoenolpyruvate--protein phosphotransferase [Azospirillaceae bacterium]|nr:phosphoenolpyruvate--protein phosphotransferase [Azospirillaceae bacterium]
MLNLAERHIRLGCTAKDKNEAIRLTGQLLVENGFVEPGYVDSILEREKIANTYLGNGIAIPHGLPQARGFVLNTGIVVVQFPQGVDWGNGEMTHIAVGIAAKSDEHLLVLANLTGVLGDSDATTRLAHTTDPRQIMAVLNGTPAPDAAEAAPVVVVGAGIAVFAPTPHGLHARPVSALVEIAKRFQATIRVHYDGKTANAKSMVSLLKLGASGGVPLTVTADGVDAAEALVEVQAGFAANLGDDGQAAGEPATPAATTPAAPVTGRIDYDGRIIAGISVSPGVATGSVWLFQRERIQVTKTAVDPEVQRRHLREALAGATVDLKNLYEEFWKKAGAAKAGIFKAHLELLDDPELLVDSEHRINQGDSAAWAWQQAYEERADLLARLNDPVLAGRAADLRDVGRRVLRTLADSVTGAATFPSHPVILVAEDLSPSDTARLDPRQVLGLCMAAGGTTSHSAIIARSLDIPAVVAAGPSVLDLAVGTPVILNGDAGVLVVNPTDRDRGNAELLRQQVAERRDAERLERYQPAITRDGKRVEVVANISAADEAEKAVEAGAEGVGLMRTEFLFLQRDNPPSEDEQAASYITMVKALNGLPIILRTLDIGGDKKVPYLSLPAEENPFLGVRGIRLCFEREDLFRTQLRAIFRAAACGPVRLMFPMIATVEELIRAKAITEAVRVEMAAAPIEIGIMIEVPSAVMMADRLAREVSFFSIGTNDLTQYVLAMDRQHPVLAPQADGLHPAVLRMIALTVEAATRNGAWVGACGGVAGDPAGAVLLAGLGVKELSVSIPSLAAVKARLRGLAMSDAEALAHRALDCANAAEVRALVQGAL